MPDGSETKYGDLIHDDHDWHNDPENDDDASEQVLEVTRHTIAVDDQRPENGYEYGLDWLFNIDQGVLVGYYRGHWLEGRTQSDPMRSPPWRRVPEPVKEAVRLELGLEPGERVPTDLPEHYTEEVQDAE